MAKRFLQSSDVNSDIRCKATTFGRITEAYEITMTDRLDSGHQLDTGHRGTRAHKANSDVHKKRLGGISGTCKNNHDKPVSSGVVFFFDTEGNVGYLFLQPGTSQSENKQHHLTSENVPLLSLHLLNSQYIQSNVEHYSCSTRC